MVDHRYGRGKFEAHLAYIEYMQTTVEHANYAGMPNAVSEDGRINWQVSSGKTTSFYEYYEARREWWERKAADLGVDDEDRFTITARRIHPTGWRPCRLCGELRNVGYYYLSHNGARKANSITHSDTFVKHMPVDEVLSAMDDEQLAEFCKLFPERAPAFTAYETGAEAFNASNSLRTTWLSPGYMGDPPDRLDGFHDYCIFCREKNDPGRSPENLRSYIHDRRAFEWWAEGDWGLADALYNSAGAGTCEDCGRVVGRISPDHVGPLACGFRQMPLFIPLCQPCNSSKNRRMRTSDVKALLEHESATGESAASWQVRPLWDRLKHSVKSDESARELSALLRAMEDLYFRMLAALLENGHARFMTTLLNPDHAFFDHEFEGLDPSTLRYEVVRSTPNRSMLRESLACRSVRIAFEDLKLYVEKPPEDRRIRLTFDDNRDRLIEEVLEAAALAEGDELDAAFDDLLRPHRGADEVEVELQKLLWDNNRVRESDQDLVDLIAERLSDLVDESDITLE